MKKIIILMLAVVMMLSSFVACTPTEGPAGESSTPDKPAESSPNKPAESTPEESEAQIGNLDPSINLGGKVISIISSDDPWMKDEVSVEGTNGNPINDAIFQRNLNVEALLSTELDNILVSGGDYGVIKQLKNTAGPDCPYHIASAPAYTCFENTASGLFYNLYDVGNIDLDQPYWANKYNEEASIGNAQYFATGAISLSLRRFIFVTFFNKDLAENYGVEDLYQVVHDKRWTMEYQTNLVSNMYTELDGMDGQTEGDSYGFLSDCQVFVDPYIASCDVKILVKDSDNFFVLEPETEKLDNMMQKIYNLYYKSGGSYIFHGDGEYSQWTKITNKFTSGEATMVTHRLIAAESEEFRGMQSAYGILPIPKFDEDQQEYYSLAHDLFTVYGVVSSVNSIDLDDVGAVMEAMAIESYRVVTPAYYEVALKGKYSKDPQSWEMLDMIVNNLKINGGLLYTINISDITQKFRTAIKNQQSNTSTILNALNLKGMNRGLSSMQTAIKAIQG